MLDNSEKELTSSSDSEVQAAEEERIEIRKRMSGLSFEDLLKIKEQMGSKHYNSTVFGVSEKKPRNDFKRANKNRPREMSSKIRPQQLKKQLNNNGIPATKKTIPRDPRFDPLCGEFDDKTFKSNYKFINDIRQSEIKQLEKEVKTCTDVERKKTIKLLIQRMNNQMREQQKHEAERNKKYLEMLEIKDNLKRGQKPVFKKKSVRKLENLIEKYEELKNTNKLQKHIEKRYKKLSTKEHRRLLE